MVINQPQPEVFEKQSVYYLWQSLNIIFEQEFSGFREAIADRYMQEEVDDVEAQYWRYEQGILNNSLMLLFLSLENYLKAKICEVSPLLLLSKQPSEWSSYSSNIDYQELYLHPFDDLLALYLQVSTQQLNAQVIDELEELRRRRNVITHGIAQGDLTPKFILDIISF